MLKKTEPSGFIAIDKPSGITSFDVIRELRRQFRIRKLGHSGVLDKPASGVLVVGANRATRLFELFGDFEKEYTAEIWLGLATTTDDLTGELTAVGEGEFPAEEDVLAALDDYTGSIEQIPPSFSLTKIGGKELYRYALEGEDVEVQPKRVTVIGADVDEYVTGIDPAEVIDGESRLAEELPKLPKLAKLRVRLRCVGGVYVRSIARDLGADLGVMGTLGLLIRTRVGPFEIEDAISLPEVAQRIQTGEDPGSMMQSLGSIAPQDSQIKLDSAQLKMVRDGRAIRRFKHHLPPAATKRGDMVYGMDPGNDLVVLLTVGSVNQHGLVELKPSKVLT